MWGLIKRSKGPINMERSLGQTTQMLDLSQMGKVTHGDLGARNQPPHTHIVSLVHSELTDRGYNERMT